MFEITEKTFPSIQRIADQMPGGFLIYRAHGNGEFILVNQAMIRITSCENLKEFKEWTKNSFRELICSNEILLNKNERVEYLIRCKDGSEKWIFNYSHHVYSKTFGDVYYVFVEENMKKDNCEIAFNDHPNFKQKIKNGFKEVNLPVSTVLRNKSLSSENKKSILVVEDNAINREIITEFLQDEFNVLTAEDGNVGIQMLQKHRENLSLVLLDVYMPVCNGFEFLKQTQSDPYLSSVPVVVTTGSNRYEDEEKCLRLGATDFITKPYNPEIMMGRIRNIIRLHESISELSIVEYDKLTGLLTMSAFLHHAQQAISGNDKVYDLGILSVIDFSSINRIYGEIKGDQVLAYIANKLKMILPDSLLARQGNNFFALRSSPAKKDEKEKLNDIKEIVLHAPIPNLRLKQGMYLNIDKSQPVSVLCDRVKMAISIGDISQELVCFSYYDSSMEQKIIEEQKIIQAFDSAILNNEFVTWIQPKVDIGKKKIVAGEALVRWIDEKENFISPGSFIPLFEREGLIQKLDEYIFRSICAYQHKQQIEEKSIVPISINLSRNSLFNKKIVELYKKIAEEEQTDLSLVPIEITESAATSDEDIKEICESFVKAGFTLQMDDFGSGFSSLSALATLPFKVLKLDKSVIDQIGFEKGDVIIKHAIQIAHELGMKVVAEGVEEQYQEEFLSLLKCDQIQGYYYSPPVKTEIFEELLTKENPFEQMRSINYHEDGILRISSADLSHYLKIFKIMFSVVRILDSDCYGYCMAKNDGSTEDLRAPCYKIWNRSQRCHNCISLRAMETHKTEHKFEVFENEVFSVYSCYLEVDGKPHVIELLSEVGTAMMHGYEKNPTLLELVQNDHIELFQDIQLGCYNRRFFEERRYSLDRISALAMIDIDDFKSINDKYGHPMGDSVLKTITETILNNIRDSDFLIRMGGDELMIGFVGMKKNRLKIKLEEIRKSIDNICILENENIHTTVSIGGTYCQGYSESARQIADHALYEGKQTKNKVVIK